MNIFVFTQIYGFIEVIVVQILSFTHCSPPAKVKF